MKPTLRSMIRVGATGKMLAVVGACTIICGMFVFSSRPVGGGEGDERPLVATTCAIYILVTGGAVSLVGCLLVYGSRLLRRRAQNDLV